MKNFYMTLLSNSSMAYYPENKTSSFTVQLPRYMCLDGDWEVALVEIHYPYTFSNVEEGHNEIQLETLTVTDAYIDWFESKENPTKTFETTWTKQLQAFTQAYKILLIQ